MTDRPVNDNDKDKVSRNTMSDLNRSWDDLLSGFRKSDDIEIHSFEDLGLDEHGLDFSSKDAHETPSGFSSGPSPVSGSGLRTSAASGGDLFETREFQRPEQEETSASPARQETFPGNDDFQRQEPRAAGDFSQQKPSTEQKNQAD